MNREEFKAVLRIGRDLSRRSWELRAQGIEHSIYCGLCACGVCRTCPLDDGDMFCPPYTKWLQGGYTKELARKVVVAINRPSIKRWVDEIDEKTFREYVGRNKHSYKNVIKKLAEIEKELAEMEKQE